ATGYNWLFFGGRHRDIDFILEDFILHCQRENVLTRLDLAFYHNFGFNIVQKYAQVGCLQGLHYLRLLLSGQNTATHPWGRTLQGRC
ncbi:MAG: hypothetical protein LBB19_04415, partial [Puniceicoccales bacterium]|nr:hypothetical protein [Puniceicoccales bacterium]